MELKEILQGFSDVKILVVGDIMLDKFVYGGVSRISPEGPVPVLKVRREDEMLGGAGNALNNLVHLGVQAEMCAVVGEDDNAKAIENQIKALGVPVDGLIKAKDRQTTVKMRYLAGHQQLLRTDYETDGEVSQDIQRAVVEHVKSRLSSMQAMIISDYGKGLLTREVLGGIISAARSAGVPVLADPKGFDYSIYKGVSAVTPNRKELSESVSGMATNSNEDIVAACNALIEQSGVEAVIATRSGDGISVVRGDGSASTHIPGADIDVFDVSGAGDTVIATAASVLAAGGSLEQAAELANKAGTIVVTKVGTAPIRIQELRDALDETNVRSEREAYMLGWDEAAEQVKRWKARGLKVGFTNGCFDILHAGHVTYLNEARGLCDRLIMGLNSDSSVRVLKGPERPVHDEQSRAAVLGALASIDMVVLFGAKEEGEDNTASALIKALQPDIYFKGGDYKVDEILETPTVRSVGGEVHVLSIVEGQSTTSSIKKIRDSEGRAA